MTVAALFTEEPNPRSPHARVDLLFDEDSFEQFPQTPGASVVTGRGTLAGMPAVVYANDAAVRGGALTSEDCADISVAIDAAAANGWPVVGIWHSGGAVLDAGVASLEGVGRVFAAIVRASGRVPQVSVVLGPAAGGAAYGPALTDVVVMGPEARVFVTGPDVVRSVTGEDVDALTLGGPATHSQQSGVAHLVAKSDDDALDLARRVIQLIGDQGEFKPGEIGADWSLAGLLPESPRRAYDVRPVIRHLLDRGAGAAPVELQPGWARSIVTTLGRLDGRTVGVVANNPLRSGGCLDAVSAEKAARFVRLCDAFGIPLVVIVDVPGYLPGVSQELGGVVRRGAKLLHAFADAQVPRVTLVTRKAYGGAYIAMNSAALGATAVLAWPGAEMDVMGASAAVRILHRRKIAGVPAEQRDELVEDLAAAHVQRTGGLSRAVALGAVDAVVAPEHTRQALVDALAAAPDRRNVHRNIPL
jgi:acetyl-CoA/propionyl-CoA carboxylase carboxyl transferase subunit